MPVISIPSRVSEEYLPMAVCCVLSCLYRFHPERRLSMMRQMMFSWRYSNTSSSSMPIGLARIPTIGHNFFQSHTSANSGDISSFLLLGYGAILTLSETSSYLYSSQGLDKPDLSTSAALAGSPSTGRRSRKFVPT